MRKLRNLSAMMAGVLLALPVLAADPSTVASDVGVKPTPPAGTKLPTPAPKPPVTAPGGEVELRDELGKKQTAATELRDELGKKQTASTEMRDELGKKRTANTADPVSAENTGLPGAKDPGVVSKTPQ